jgi:hypothetical protein
MLDWLSVFGWEQHLDEEQVENLAYSTVDRKEQP